MNIFIKYIIVTLLFVTIACKATNSDTTSRGLAHYNAAVSNGLTNLQIIQQINKLFPGTDNFISYFNGVNGEPTWNSVVGLNNRYILTMQFEITLSDQDNKITPAEKPRFHLVEVDSVTRLTDGRLNVVYARESQQDFGEDKWQLLIDSGGDLSAFGIETTPKVYSIDFQQIWKQEAQHAPPAGRGEAPRP